MALSVIVTVKSTGPGWLLVGPEGVPVITPCTLKLSPAGSVFAGTVYISGDTPPEAASACE